MIEFWSEIITLVSSGLAIACLAAYLINRLALHHSGVLAGLPEDRWSDGEQQSAAESIRLESDEWWCRTVDGVVVFDGTSYLSRDYLVDAADAAAALETARREAPEVLFGSLGKLRRQPLTIVEPVRTALFRCTVTYVYESPAPDQPADEPRIDVTHVGSSGRVFLPASAPPFEFHNEMIKAAAAALHMPFAGPESRSSAYSYATGRLERIAFEEHADPPTAAHVSSHPFLRERRYLFGFIPFGWRGVK